VQNNLSLLMIPAFAVFFVTLWLLICRLLAHLSGWSALARDFPGPSEAPAPQFLLQAGSMNGCRYRGCLNVGISPHGMSLSLFFLFRAGHPPLLIPWTNLSPFQPENALWTTVYATTITGAGRDIRLTLHNRRLADALNGTIAQARTLRAGAGEPAAH
jgi:hypothetical protein